MSWETVRIFIADTNTQRKPAVRLSMRVNGKLIMSHTCGFVRNSKFEPIMHIPDTLSEHFMKLMQKSFGEAHVLQLNADKAVRGSLATPMPEVTRVRPLNKD